MLHVKDHHVLMQGASERVPSAAKAHVMVATISGLSGTAQVDARLSHMRSLRSSFARLAYIWGHSLRCDSSEKGFVCLLSYQQKLSFPQKGIAGLAHALPSISTWTTCSSQSETDIILR